MVSEVKQRGGTPQRAWLAMAQYPDMFIMSLSTSVPNLVLLSQNVQCYSHILLLYCSTNAV